jgi:aspartate-semialdehyde dehydrogenase
MIEVGVLGATGLVGQRFIELLINHPWFRIAKLAASERSVSKKYGEIGRWKLETVLPEAILDETVVPPEPIKMDDIPLVFSALPSNVAGPIEAKFARSGKIVISNAASHRMDPLVPIMNPEANADHINLIDKQRKKYDWKGAIMTNPNCTAAVLTLSLKPLLDGFGLKTVIVTSMQAVSGAGYPGVPSLDIIDNVIPYIKDEEPKVEVETKKILGKRGGPADFSVSASCNRVPTIDGHIESIVVETKKKCTEGEAVNMFSSFKAEPQQLKLPSAPEKPVVVRLEEDRPQPRFDRMEGNGMSVVVGRVRADPSFKSRGIKYTALGHNTIRGAAGCAILIAELLKAKGYLDE